MKFFKLLFLLIFLLSFSLDAGKKSEEIIIELKSETPLTATYIDSIKKESELISDQHAQDLQSVLHFDFNYNGKTWVLSQKEVGEYKKNRSTAEWRALGVAYVFRPTIRENFLTLSVLSTVEDKICYAEEMKLTGDLNYDRRLIHAFAYRFHKSVFKEEGIYLSQILYTYKERNVSDAQYASVSEEVYKCDFDGGNPQQLTFENSHCVTPHPVLSKDGKKVEGFFYVSYKLGQPKIYWSKFDQKKALRLSYIPGNQFMPCMSKQGDQVLFINDAPGNPEVFMQEFKPGIGSIGKPKQIFACRRAVQSSPIFSPDGKQIAFVSDKDGVPQIFVMPIPKEGMSQKDLKPVLITKKNRENTKPSWSPDGTKIAYIAKVDGIRQVWIYDFITNQESQLTFGGGNKENPQWAFNSLHIAFNSVGGDGSDLYIVNLNQPKAVRIKPANGVKRFPAWIKKDSL